MPTVSLRVNSLPTRMSQLFIWAIGLIGLDIFIYGWLLPFFAVMLTSWITDYFHFDPEAEILFMVIAVVSLLVFILNLKFERRFWKHFFAHEWPYMNLLNARELLNIGLLASAVHDLIGIIRSIGHDHGLKSVYLTEGAKYVFYHNSVLGYGEEDFLRDNWRHCVAAKESAENAPTVYLFPPVDTSSMTYLEIAMLWLENLWVYGYSNLLNQDTPVDRESERCLRFAKHIHAAELALTLAYITAHVGKVLYFSTLNAYARAMDIFVSMHSSSTFPISYHNSAYASEASTNNIYESFAGSEEDSEDDDDDDYEEEEFANLLVDRATSFSMAHIPPTRQLLYAARLPSHPPQRSQPRLSSPTQRPQVQPGLSSPPGSPQRPEPRPGSPQLRQSSPPQRPQAQSGLSSSPGGPPQRPETRPPPAPAPSATSPIREAAVTQGFY